jgi:hypothetical protein
LTDDKFYCEQYGNYRIVEIKKLTPTGRIIDQHDNVWIDYSRGNGFNRQHLQPITQEIKNKIEKNNIILQLQTKNWDHFTLEKLKLIYNIIKE